jgi:Bacterial archaeo-eukaryotic release factor family 2
VIEQAVGTCGPQFVVVAGDGWTRGAVLEALSEPVLARTVESPSVGPSLEDDVAAALARVRDERLTAAVDRFNERRGKDGRAVDGLHAVVRALADGQVASLLLACRPPAPGGTDRGGEMPAGPAGDGTTASRTVWIGPRCTDLATGPDELRDRGVTEPVPDRADAALIRALAGTDGELLLVTLEDWRAAHGVGALLRYA